LTTGNIGAERLDVNRFDTLSWQEIIQIPDEDLSEHAQLSDDEDEALSAEERGAMFARDEERLQRKYCGRDPEELAEEQDFDPSSEPAWFQTLWATDISKLATAELEWWREHKWDLRILGLPDDVDPDDVSDEGRRLWHRRLWTMTRDEFEEAHAYSKDRVVVSYFRFLDEQERRENASLAKASKQRREQKSEPMAQVIPLAQPQPDPTRGYASIVARDERKAAKKAKEKPIIWRRVSDLKGKVAPARRWLINEFVPMRNVTNYTGDGGIGKSLVALQLAVAVALGRKWLGMPVLESGPVIVYSAEDEFDETHRRLEDICREMSVDIGDLKNLDVAAMAGMDAMLSIADDSRMMEPTYLWDDLRYKAKVMKPKLVVIDTSADVYGGDENTRQQVKQFVGMLVGMSFDFDCAVMLLSHPSVSGMIDGTGRSGTTGWNNAFRSRLYQDRVLEANPAGPGMIEPNPNLRVIRNNKLNYGKSGKKILIKSEHGIFFNEDVAEISPAEAAKAAERVFLQCLALMEAQGRDVNTNPKGNYAPKVFAALPQAAGHTKNDLRSAMERLLKDKAIRLAQDGPESRRRYWLTTKPPSEPVSEGPVELESDNKLDRAIEFLRERLANGPVQSSTLISDASESLISRTTLYRAAAEIGVKSVKDGIYALLILS
jgi:RecA-family ATPase